jgi:hypothetical protein
MVLRRTCSRSSSNDYAPSSGHGLSQRHGSVSLFQGVSGAQTTMYFPIHVSPSGSCSAGCMIDQRSGPRHGQQRRRRRTSCKNTLAREGNWADGSLPSRGCCVVQIMVSQRFELSQIRLHLIPDIRYDGQRKLRFRHRCE